MFSYLLVFFYLYYVASWIIFFNIKKYKYVKKLKFWCIPAETFLKYLNGDIFDEICFVKKYWDDETLNRPVQTMINLQNSRFRVWNRDKTMKLISKQIRKLNYQTWKKLNLKKGSKKSDSSKPISVVDATPRARPNFI